MPAAGVLTAVMLAAGMAFLMVMIAGGVRVKGQVSGSQLLYCCQGGSPVHFPLPSRGTAGSVRNVRRPVHFHRLPQFSLYLIAPCSVCPAVRAGLVSFILLLCQGPVKRALWEVTDFPLYFLHNAKIHRAWINFMKKGHLSSCNHGSQDCIIEERCRRAWCSPAKSQKNEVQ